VLILSLCYCSQEVDALEADSRFTMSGNLASLGMHTSLWTTARKLDEEDNLYRFAGLATHTWFDDRLLRICKVRLPVSTFDEFETSC